MLSIEKLNDLLDKRCVPEPNTGCLLWEGGRTSRGYPAFNRRANGKIECFALHREVLQRKINRKLQKGEVARHLCGTPNCLEASHLAPGSHADNMVDMVRMDRQAKGERSGRAKVNEKIVVEIRQACESGVSRRIAAQFFGLTHPAVSAIVTRKTWGHVK